MAIQVCMTPRRIGGSLLAAAGFLLSSPTWSATQCVNPNAPAPLEICVQDDATPGVWVSQNNGRTRQYYGEYSWGSSFYLGGETPQRFSSQYFGSAAMTPVSNSTSGNGSAADPYVITTVVALGATGLRFTQQFRYVNGDRYFSKIWTLENTGSTTHGDLRFYHGGDTYFGGDDSARSWYDADLRMVYVNNETFSNSGYMAFYANPLTPHSHYHAGSYWSGYTTVTMSGDLSDTADSSFMDAGYYLQWDRGELQPGESWRIEAFETWSPPGSLQLLTPGDENVMPGSTVRKTFKIHNLSAYTPLNLTWSTSDSAGWGVSLPQGNAASLAPLQVIAVPVDLQVPAGVSAGDSTVITLDVSDGALNSSSGSTRARIPVTDYSFTTRSMLFGSHQIGTPVELVVTLVNGAEPVSIGQVGAANPLATPFSVVADHCSNATVPAGGSCMITVRFTPAMAGEFTDSLGIPVAGTALVNETIAVAGEAIEALYTLTAGAGTGGAISPASIQVQPGSTAAFTLTPDAGYRIDSASGCGGALDGTLFTTAPAAGDCAVTASFQRIAVAIGVAPMEGGQVTPDATSVYYGDTVTFTLVPATGYRLASIGGCGGTLDGNQYTTAPLTAACTITGGFQRIPVIVGGPGTVSGGQVSITSPALYYGDVATYLLTPAHGHVVGSVSGCPGNLQATEFVTAPLVADCTLSVSFVPQIVEVSVAGRGAGGGGGGSTGWLGLGGLLLLMLRRLRSTAMLATLGVASMAGAQAGETRERAYHVGASLERATSSNSREGMTRALQAQGHAVSVGLDEVRAAWRLHAGWSLSRHLHAEVGYSDLGRVRTRFEGSMPVLAIDDFLADAAQVHPRTANGFDLSLVARHAVTSRWSLQARAGVFRWDAQRRVEASDGRVVHLREDGANLLLGAGLVRTLTHRLDASAEWMRYEMGNESVQTAGLALRYHW